MKSIKLLLIFITTIMLTSWSLETTKYSYFDKKISIQYTGQVVGFPTQDVVTYEYTPINNTKGKLNCIMSRQEFNPYDLSESYTILKNEENGIEIDLSSIIHPMNLSRSSNMTISQQGDKFDLPKNLSVNQNLDDKFGSIQIELGENMVKRLQISVTDRRIVAKEKLTIDGKKYDTFKMTYRVSTNKYFNETLFENDTEQIEEWVKPDLGFLKRTSNRVVSQYNDEEVTNSYTSNFSLSATKISF